MHKQSETAEDLVHTEPPVETERTQAEITRSGNPGKPQGEDGNAMLLRMNDSHLCPSTQTHVVPSFSWTWMSAKPAHSNRFRNSSSVGLNR